MNIFTFEGMNIDIRSLMPQFFKLSKSTIIKGMQCERYLYLLKHKPKEKTPHDWSTLQKFEKGRDFEGTFKDSFGQGIDVNALLKKDVWSIGASYTKAIIDISDPAVLFEACFVHQSTLVMADVCVVNEDGSFDIYEVKNGLEAKDVFIRDMAIQFYIIKNATKGLRKIYLVLNDGQDGFLIEDKTEILKSLVPQMEQLIPELLQMLQEKSAPKIAMGNQCHAPYECEYIAYCTKNK